MKKVLIVFLLLAGVATALLVFGNRNSMSLPLTAASADRRELETKTLSFLEDLKFKDFTRAASYHSTEDRKKVDIPALIERIFQVKPETLDIIRYEVESVDIDSTGRRARSKTKTVIKILNSNEIKEPEVMLYWFKDPTEGWVMELQSSIR